MKSKKFLIISIFLGVLGVGGAWWFYEHNHGHHNAHSGGEQKKAETYSCPMHPQIVSDEPGSCPICGMDLVLASEMEEEEDHTGHNHENEKSLPTGHADVKLNSKKQQLIGVKITKVEKKKLFKSIRAPGRIAFDPELYTAQSEYLEALKQWRRVLDSPISDVRESTQQMIRSSKIRLKVLGLSDDQISRLTKKGRLSEGLLVSGKGQENWIYADIFEVDLPYIKDGLSAQISANFLQGKTLAAKVISVDQVINPETRTAKVRLQLLDHDSSIRPESYVNVTIFAPVGEHLAVPIESLMDTGREVFVFSKIGDGKFEPKKVTVVLETESQAGIGSGLTEGEEVVVGGNFMLDSESRLKAVIQGAQSQSAPETSGSGHKH